MKLPQTFWRPAYGEILRTILTTAAAAGVLIILINQQTAANNQAKANNALVLQLRKAVTDLESNTNMKLTDAQKHLDCIVTYFTTPGRTGNTTIDPINCQVNNPSPPKVMGVAPPQTQPSLTVTPPTQPSLSSPSSSPSPPSFSSPFTPKPGLLRQIIKFLGL